MSDQNSTQYAKSNVASTLPTAAKTYTSPEEFGGKLRVAYANFAASGYTWAQNDRGVCFKLPAYSTPLLYVAKYGAFGASVTLDIGYGVLDASTENTFKSALDISSAGTTGPACIADPTKLTSDTVVYVQFEGANPADDKQLEIWIYYVID